MIHRIFLLVTSWTLLLSAVEQCPDHYNPKWFEEASDELVLLLDEYFTEKNISLPPTLSELQKEGMIKVSAQRYELPHATRHYRELEFPIRPGLWRHERFDRYISTTHLLIKEPEKLSEIRAINTYNDLLGAYWGNYMVTGYRMRLSPEDTRIRYRNSYIELNVDIYGLKNDATPLRYTYADILISDYSRQVNAFIHCKEEK